MNFFLQGIIEASQSATEDTKKILELQQKHQALLWEKKISSPFATVVLNYLFYKPIISISDIEEHFGVSFPTASHLVKQLQEKGILKEITGQKRAKKYIYADYMEILSEGTAPL